MTPDQYCQQKAAASGSSFYYSFLFLPEARRRAIMALYAFCREVDDVVDEVSDASVAQQKLAWWHGELHNMLDGKATHPVTQALAPCLAEFSIPAHILFEILEGMQTDLQQTRYLDFVGLQRYCYLVAGAVGVGAARIFGQTETATSDYAKKLGEALQLTNIIRDVGDDARRGRIYLPMNELQQFGVTAQALLNGQASTQTSDNFLALMRFQAARAHQAYADARALLPAADFRAQRPGLIMAAIYQTLLREIERDNFAVLSQRISLTPMRKLWIAWKTWIYSSKSFV